MEANASVDQGVLGQAWLTHHCSQARAWLSPLQLSGLGRGPALFSDSQEPQNSRPGSGIICCPH